MKKRDELFIDALDAIRLGWSRTADECCAKLRAHLEAEGAPVPDEDSLGIPGYLLSSRASETQAHMENMERFDPSFTGRRQDKSDARVHDLKCWPHAFDAVRDGTKRFEWRKNDRDYRVGDILRLRRWNAGRQEYSPIPPFEVRVTYLLSDMFNVPTGYVVMSVEPIDQPAATPCPNCAGETKGAK